jgi:hypothetical protein
MNASQLTRCPYCTDRNDFKPMVGHLDGRHICAKCGHLICPYDATFVCTCSQCLELNRPLSRMKHSLGRGGDTGDSEWNRRCNRRIICSGPKETLVSS